MFDSLTILLTFRCNYQCDHCVFRCGPHREETVDLALALRTVDAAHAVARPLALLSLSGGEPFLVPDLMQALVRHARGLGIRAGVVTNAFWARSEARAVEILSPLHEAGLAVLTTSLDTFHLDFAEAVRVTHALRAALALGLETHLNIVVKRGVPIRADSAPLVLGMTPDELARVHVHEFAPTLVGFAEDRLSPDEVHRDALHVIGEPCGYVLRSATLTPDGSIYGCCGVGGASDHGPSQLLYAGHLDERSFADIIRDIHGNLLFNLIARVGPHRVVELAQQREPTLTVRDRYAHICDVCQEMTHNQELRRVVAEALRELAP